MSWKLVLKPHVPALFVALVLFGSTAAAFAYIHRLQSLTADMVLENLAGLRTAHKLEFDLRNTRTALFQYAISGEERHLSSLDRLHAHFEESLREMCQIACTEDELCRIREIHRRFDDYLLGIGDLRVLDGDDRERRRTAGSLGTLLTQQLLPLCHEVLEDNARLMEERAETHRGVSLRLQFLLLLTGLLVPLAGVFAGYLISRSVTRQLARSREELLRAEQLAAVGQLAAGMAHELRNPLTSIKLMVQTASDDEPADLGVIEDEVRRMERTIQTCLDFARPQQPHRSVFDLRDAVAEAGRLVEGRVRRQRLDLVIEQPETPLPVSADRHQLHQLLVNLLLNAIDSVGPRGRLGVATTGQAGGQSVSVRVWDEGSGIPGELLPTIFDPFVSSKETGTGLGLSISRQIVESHGGQIAARNRTGGGAEFTIQLQCSGEPNYAHAAGHRRRAEHPALLPQGVPG